MPWVSCVCRVQSSPAPLCDTGFPVCWSLCQVGGHTFGGVLISTSHLAVGVLLSQVCVVCRFMWVWGMNSVLYTLGQLLWLHGNLEICFVFFFFALPFCYFGGGLLGIEPRTFVRKERTLLLCHAPAAALSHVN